MRFYINFQRREYPDGTVKILYEDGRQETQYSSGLATKANIIIFCSFPEVLTVAGHCQEQLMQSLMVRLLNMHFFDVLKN